MKAPLPMVRPPNLAFLAGLCALSLGGTLAGCADAPSAPAADIASATSNPIQISRTRLARTVTFQGDAIAPDPSQISALFVFIAANSVGPSDTVLVEGGPGGFQAARANALAASLAAAGLRPRVVVDAEVPAGAARVVVERYVAIAPDCPRWSTPPGPNFKNFDQQNFGCADATNLAAMVADPKDLAMGADLADQKGDAATRPIFNYRTGVPSVIGAAGAGSGGGASAGGGASGAGQSGSGGGMGYGPSGATGP